ncbi:protein kinase [Streptomyces sp. NBC_00190]|uniref:serine/threonine-protein kinase n=1 Tax=unclassified Streptomyces TaxID=2593676 RepID=UPI002E2E1BAF|nr:protein kinase [Streptomyces sp. NBC_00190]WSZ38640.1 protein kinase [Streptomyces sp. NBC_00868]
MPTGDAQGGELVGKVLGGRYRVTSMIGRGGMGVVARAVDELLNREVAVKVLRAYTDASAAELADLRARMQREAQAAARIRHRGVVTVHDVTHDEGLPVIVMELVDGPSLDDVLAERGALAPHEAAAIGAELMDALDAAHRAGVLHRDVKPGNVLMERGGRVVLTDFGIASMEASDDDAMAKLTRSGEIVGSLDYLPPERAQGREPGPASDIWSLGMTLYAAVEGTSPFRRTSVWSTLSAIVGEPLPEPRRAGPLAPVLQALMAKDPEGRPTADRARAMLRQVAASSGEAAPPIAATHAPVVGPPTPPAPSVVASPAPGPAAGFGPPPAYQRPQPFPQPAPHTGYPPPGAPTPHAGAAGGRPSRRSRTVIAAAAAVVLAAGGVTYAVMNGHGGKGGDRTHAAKPGAGPASHSGRPSAGGVSGGAAAPSAPPSAGSSGKPSATSSAKPVTTPRASASSAAKPTPVSTSCGGWSHRDPAPGTYGYMSGEYHLETGPYQTCPAVSLAKAGTKLWYHCYVVNAHGNKWTYVRIDGTNTSGWMSDDNLTKQKGPSTPC